jgi:signal transduction histidine kinase/CheY-like chemotaxis protein
MKIRTRLLLLTISVAIVVMLVALKISTSLLRGAVERDAGDQLTIVLESRRTAIMNYLEVARGQLLLLSINSDNAKNLQDLSRAYAKLGPSAQTIVQQNFLAQDVRRPSTIPSSSAQTEFSRVVERAGTYLTQLNSINGWDDVLLIDPRGNVVFSVRREKDFGTNLMSGPWKDTNLAKSVALLLRDAVPGVLSFADFAHYTPSGNRAAAFAAMPVFDFGRHAFLGVVAIQLSARPLEIAANTRRGQGRTGETFIVGKDGWILSALRFEPDSAALTKQLKTKAISDVLGGKSGLDTYTDYRGVEAYEAFAPLVPFQEAMTVGDKPIWGLVAKADTSEIFEEYYELRLTMLLTGAVLAVLSMGVGFWGSKTITSPLLHIRSALSKLAKGEETTVPHLDRRDEIGEIAQAAESFHKMTVRVEHDHWIAANVAELTAAASAQASLEQASTSILHFLCSKLEVPVGAIYLMKDGTCVRIGAHGLARRSQADDTFQPDSGLISQCAKDRQALVLSPVPPGLAIISTGLAEFQPVELVLYPIGHNEAVLAVVELAATKSLTPVQHEFLRAVIAPLGIILANLQAAEHNAHLLIETRKQSRELTVQSETLLSRNKEMQLLTEELRRQTEEMKSQNEEIKTNQEELRAQQEELQVKNQALELQSGQLTSMLAESKMKTEELERVNQYKSEFLANMSHELRTPLNSVLILSKNLAENEDGNLTNDQVVSASVISESGNQLLTLINDILDLAKVEAGKMLLVKEAFHLEEVLEYLRHVFAPQATKKHIGLQIRANLDLSESIFTDSQRLTQVLSNLLSNAIKFTDNGEVSVTACRNLDDLVFEIVDSGIGIAPEKLDLIFGAFQQVDGSTSRKYGGSGLGLAISRHLVELLDGDIRVQSQVGKGSTFKVRLRGVFNTPMPSPAGDTVATMTDAVAAHPVDVPSPVLPPRKGIMIVEDDQTLLAVLGRMINALGYVPISAPSAEEALKAIAARQPAGVLLDVGLPGMSGLDLLRHLKEDPSTERLPVFMMSGASDSGEAKKLGALEFLQKPLTRDTIANAIRTMIDAGKVVTPTRILLVDDNSADIRCVQQLFKNDPVEVVPVTTAARALELLQAHHYDVVVLDLQLPDMTGFEWLKRAHSLLNPPPVVVYSARDLSEEEVFELKETTSSIVIKGPLTDRLREEVLAAQRDQTASSGLPRTNVPVSGKTLLLVDDDARNLFALTKVLRAKGYGVEVASDSAHALEVLSHGRFDAVLTDIMMPSMDGYALIRKIRSLGHTQLPIIAITAKAMQGDAELCLDAGATAYLPKPVDVDKLLELLRGA